jgi:molybdopterin-guanine dinucleotide biosynthesis protein A
MMPMFDVQGFILVGGQSRRMGKDKANLRFGDQTSVELIAAPLRNVTRSVTTVGRPDLTVGALPNIPDLRPRWGPLAGIEAALRHATSTYCLIVACDFPFVTEGLFAHLLGLAGGLDAVVPLQDDNRPQPLCAVYRVEACLTATESAIAAGQHSPRALLERVNTRYIPFDHLSPLDGSSHFFFNVNTPESYERAQRILIERLRSKKSEVRG